MKAIFKSELKYIPIVGIGAYFAENIFIKRKWEADKAALVNGLKTFLDYPFRFNVIIYSTSIEFIPPA